MKYNIGNLIASIKNGYKSHLFSIKVAKTKLNVNFLFLLYKQGLIRSFFILTNDRQILVYLKYNNKIPLIFDIKLISKPSKRVY